MTEAQTTRFLCGDSRSDTRLPCFSHNRPWPHHKRVLGDASFPQDIGKRCIALIGTIKVWFGGVPPRLSHVANCVDGVAKLLEPYKQPRGEHRFFTLITTSLLLPSSPTFFLTMTSTRTTSISSASSVDSRLSVRRHQTIDCPSLREWLDKEAQRQWEEWNSAARSQCSQTKTDLRTIFEYAPQPTLSPAESSIDVSSSAGEPHSPQSYTDEQAWLSVHCAANGPMAPPPPSPKIIPANLLLHTQNQSLANERNRSRCESLPSTRGAHEVGILSISSCVISSLTANTGLRSRWGFPRRFHGVSL